MKDREDSTAGFKQVFVIYIDQKLSKSGEKETYYLLRFTNGDLLGLIVFKNQSNICAVLLGDIVQ